MTIPVWLFIVGVIVLSGGSFWLGAVMVDRRVKENEAFRKRLLETPKDCSEDGYGHC